MSGKMKMDRKHLMIILGCMLLQAIPFGMAQNVPPLFFKPLQDTFGLSSLTVGLIFTFGTIASAVVSPFIGKLFETKTTKVMMLGGLFVCCLGLYANVFSSQGWHFIVANMIAQAGCFTFSSLGVPHLIGRWFDDNTKAQALGIAFAGGSIGNFFLQPIFSYLLDTMKISHVYFIGATAATIIGALVIIFMLKDREEVVVDADKDGVNDEMVEIKGIGAAATRKQPLFWVLSIGMMFIGLTIAAQSVQYSVTMSQAHINASIRGIVGSVFAVGCLFGNVGGGFLFTKLGVFKSSLIAFIFQVISAAMMVVVLQTSSSAAAFVWAICYGLTVYIYMSGPAVLVQTLFGMKDSSQNLGTFNILYSLGFAFGNTLFGMVSMNAGQQNAWFVSIGLIVIGYTLLLVAVKKLQKRKFAEVKSEK